MLITPKKIVNGPYEDEQFVEMVEKVDNICGKGYADHYIRILTGELRGLSPSNKTLNKEAFRNLNKKMNPSNRTPCEEVFMNSIYMEFYKKFRHQPINYILEFFENLPIMSKN